MSALDKVNAAMCALDLQNIHTCVKARRAVRNRAKVRVRGYEGEEACKDPARIDPATQSGYRCMSLDIVLINNPSILSCYSCPLSAESLATPRSCCWFSGSLFKKQRLSNQDSSFWSATEGPVAISPEDHFKGARIASSLYREKILSTGSLKYVSGGPVNGGEMRWGNIGEGNLWEIRKRGVYYNLHFILI